MKILHHVLRTTEYVANHVVGSRHTMTHRKWTGVVIMTLGIGLAHMGAHANVFIAASSDFIGYSLHALGFVPFIKSIEDANNN